MTTTTARRQRRPWSRRVRDGQGRRARVAAVEPIYYWFLVPTLILFTLAITIPAVIGIFFSFTNSIGLGEWEFIGLTNYIALSSDPADRPELPVHLRILARHGCRGEHHRPAPGGRADVADPAEDAVAHDLRNPHGDLGHRHRVRLQVPVLELAAGVRHASPASRGSRRASSPNRTGHGWRSSSSRHGRRSPERCSSTSPASCRSPARCTKRPTSTGRARFSSSPASRSRSCSATS